MLGQQYIYIICIYIYIFIHIFLQHTGDGEEKSGSYSMLIDDLSRFILHVDSCIYLTTPPKTDMEPEKNLLEKEKTSNQTTNIQVQSVCFSVSVYFSCFFSANVLSGGGWLV